MQGSGTTNLDSLYGVAIDPDRYDPQEIQMRPASWHILDEQTAPLLKAVMDATNGGLMITQCMFATAPILWVIDEDGSFNFALEEIVSASTKRFVSHRKYREQVIDGNQRLGHPSLIWPKKGRIGGELVFDQGWAHMRMGWYLMNTSGRYGGSDKGRTESHLREAKNLVEEFGIEVGAQFIP